MLLICVPAPLIMIRWFGFMQKSIESLQPLAEEHELEEKSDSPSKDGSSSSGRDTERSREHLRPPALAYEYCEYALLEYTRFIA
jgi:hypothetical protein